MGASLAGQYRRGRLPRPVYPRNAERAYESIYRKIFQLIGKKIDEDLVRTLPWFANRFDSNNLYYDGFSDLIIETVKKIASAVIPFLNFDNQLKDIATNINTTSATEWAKTVKKGIGIDVFQVEPWAKDAIDSFVAENVSLIKSIPENFLREVEGIVIREIRNGTRVESIASILKERFAISQKRALLIARDQVGKFNGSLAKKRQESYGVKRYIWRTVQDERVRASHRSQNGKEYSWDKPPPTGHPGQDYQCRCFAEPIFDLEDEP